MNLKNCAKLMSMATVTALIYIHMQLQIVELAYKGKDKQRHIHDLIDDNGILTHQILTLKSANSLGRRLLDKDEGLQFMGQANVMTITSKTSRPGVVSSKSKIQDEKPFWNLLALFGTREAKAWEN